MSGAVWNFTRTLAETWVLSPYDKAALRRSEEARIERERRKCERTQLGWKPEPGRIRYAGANK